MLSPVEYRVGVESGSITYSTVLVIFTCAHAHINMRENNFEARDKRQARGNDEKTKREANQKGEFMSDFLLRGFSWETGCKYFGSDIDNECVNTL